MFSRKLVKPPPSEKTGASPASSASMAFSFNKVLQKPISKSFNLGRCETGVRDAVIHTIQHAFAEEPFTAPFVAHLKKIAVDAFDPYSELEFVLEEFNVRLIFQTIRRREDVMTYTLPDLSLEPDPRLASNVGMRKMFGWF
jgi:hypothetical protein